MARAAVPFADFVSVSHDDEDRLTSPQAAGVMREAILVAHESQPTESGWDRPLRHGRSHPTSPDATDEDRGTVSCVAKGEVP